MKKYNLLFDGTILTNEFNKNAARTGIFFAAKNLFNNFLKREDINIFLYCDLARLPLMKEYIKKYNLNISVLNECGYNFIQKLKARFRELKSSCDKKQHPLKKAFFDIGYLLLSTYIKASEPLIESRDFIKKLKDIDLYFSPYHKVPLTVKNQKHILSSVYLHDVIPVLFPENFKKFGSMGRFSFLLSSLNDKEIYFANSECTKRDFLKTSKKITAEQITTAYLAAAENFVKNEDMEKLRRVKSKYNIPQDKKYIFSLCTLEPRKNLIRTVKTFIKFIEKHNIEDLVFVLAGGCWSKFITVLEKEIGALDKYKDKIIKAGYIDDEDLPVLYSGAVWFVYTSQYEGFGLPPLEAMKCGCPVITSNNSSLPEVMGNAGIMIDWNSDEAHIQAFEKYYFNENLRKENAQKGLKRAELFSWEKCASKIADTLKAEYEKRS